MIATRTPSGLAPWPLVLVEGEEFAGALEAALLLSSSQRVGQTFVFDAEGHAEMHARLGRFELVDWDGKVGRVVDLLAEILDVPTAGGVPNVVVLDVSWLWSKLVELAGWKARQSKESQRLLQRDPTASISIPKDLWQEADSRFWRCVTPLRVAPCTIGVLVAGARDDEVDSKRGVAGSCHAWVHCRRPRSFSAVGVVGGTVPADGLPLPAANPLEHLIFEVMPKHVEFSPLNPGVVGNDSRQAASTTPGEAEA